MVDPSSPDCWFEKITFNEDENGPAWADHTTLHYDLPERGDSPKLFQNDTP